MSDAKGYPKYILVNIKLVCWVKFRHFEYRLPHVLRTRLRGQRPFRVRLFTYNEVAMMMM